MPRLVSATYYEELVSATSYLSLTMDAPFWEDHLGSGHDFSGFLLGSGCFLGGRFPFDDLN